MAVQAQYPSNLLLFNRDEQERKEMDYSSPPTPLPLPLPLPLPQQPLPPSHAFLDHPSPVFFANGAANNNNNNNNNQRKRARDQSTATATATATVFQMVPTPQMNLFSPSMNIQSPAIVNLAQLQHQHHPSVVSTGLRLSNLYDDNPSHSLHTHNQSNLYVQQDQLASLINQHKDEIEHLLIAQGEQLRRTLADRQQTHYRALLAAAEETAARRLREKELELNRAVRRAAELEDRIARLRTESLTWQAKAMADQATAANLHAQIQQATMAAAANSRRSEECCGESGAEDAESAHVDPNRVEEPRRRACRVCHVSDVSVVLLPCRHLCLCYECDAAVRDADAVRCPVCHAVRTGSIQALLS